jgi:phosphatidylinositol glycan class B
MWSLGCEPPLNVSDLRTYHDQTDVFYQSPKKYIEKHFPSSVDPAFPPSLFPRSLPGQVGEQDWKHEWPRHLIMFGELLKDEYGVKELFEEKGYREVWKRGREWEGEGTRTGGVRVWRWDP